MQYTASSFGAPILSAFGSVAEPPVRRYLDFHKISYEWIDIDVNPEAEKFVLETNRRMRSVPTLVFEDGSILVEPSNSRLAEKLGIVD